MRMLALLFQATLVAQVPSQAPDQVWRDKVKTLCLEGDAKAAIQIQYQGEKYYGFEGPPKSHMAKEGRFFLQKTGNTVQIQDDKGTPLNTWTLPVIVERGNENPAKPENLEAWFQPNRVSVLLNPAQALLDWVQQAELKETRKDVCFGHIVQVFRYVFETPHPKEYDTRAKDTQASLQVWIDPTGVPLKAEIQTGYRGRFHHFHPFGRSTTLRWAYAVEAGHLRTVTYDLNETHYDDWDRTKTLLGIKAQPLP